MTVLPLAVGGKGAPSSRKQGYTQFIPCSQLSCSSNDLGLFAVVFETVTQVSSTFLTSFITTS